MSYYIVDRYFKKLSLTRLSEAEGDRANKNLLQYDLLSGYYQFLLQLVASFTLSAILTDECMLLYQCLKQRKCMPMYNASPTSVVYALDLRSAIVCRSIPVLTI